ncbi:DUF6779 domain-containing protein [Blastococcus sp. VKM Ac-2987]|uniref:DUF6779 domain-containing protein n=1 Tax=Blastococcus sp. VKM Ac-2987 TaxID=3004141 RepID=UPI0022AB5D86|nr:DUF6779 domain-containing protein [Blastococcus sp. VKM Ac-2987]MCZ2858289.1 hypothetical protein [Blastococcus sp. VKM Ac-2987]
MPAREDDDVARGPAQPGSRTLLQAGGFVLAAGATLAVFLTDDAQLLRIAVVAVAWAFVLATFAAGRRGADQVRAAAREADLRRAYELELEREVAARREYELELENELRRETEESMREELDALRGDIAALSGLRDEVARVAGMRGDLAALGGLRDEVARVAALRDEVARVAGLRDDVAALTGLRGELGQLAALREDMGRLRVELSEQLSSEMLVERIVMRTQAGRLPGEATRLDGPARTLDGGATWSDEAPPRELTGGWPAIRLDEPRPTQQFEQVRTSTWSAAPSPATTSFPAPTPPARVPAAAPPPSVPRPPVPAATRRPAPPATAVPPATASAPPVPAPEFGRHDRSAAHEDDPHLGSRRSRHAAGGPPPADPPPSPLEWLAARSLIDVPADDAPRRRRTDDSAPPLPGAAAATTQHPAVTPHWAAPQPQADGVPGPDAPDRLAQILAENGVSAASGGRRRRRYRDDDESDDVLARVLGR